MNTSIFKRLIYLSLITSDVYLMLHLLFDDYNATYYISKTTTEPNKEIYCYSALSPFSPIGLHIAFGGIW